MSAPVSSSAMKVLPALRKATELSLKFDPRIVILTPHTRVQKAGGVYENEIQNTRAPQTFNVESMESGQLGDVSRSLESDGAEGHRWYFYLVGRHDAQMAINDTWKDGNTNYRIVSMMPKNDYERRAVVEAFGKDPNYGS